MTFIINITKSGQSLNTTGSSIITVGDLVIQGHSVAMRGTFASFFKSLTLQNDGFIHEAINGRNFSKVELNGILRSPVYIDGVLIFTDGSKTTCNMALRRRAGEIKILALWMIYCEHD